MGFKTSFSPFRETWNITGIILKITLGTNYDKMCKCLKKCRKKNLPKKCESRVFPCKILSFTEIKPVMEIANANTYI